MLISRRNKIVEELNQLKNNQFFQKHVNNIQCGRFARNPEDNNYNSRIAYTKRLREYMYNPVLLNLILSDLDLKTLFFKTFGYKGQMSFTIYPDIWLRDLPLLDFGENVYLGNGIVLGTNQVSRDQRFITVGTIKIGTNTIIDQRGAIGYNSTLGQNCSLGFQVSLGIKSNIGNNTSIGECTNIGHGVKIGDAVRIGQCCTIGNMSIIENEVSLDLATVIPAYSLVSSNGIINYRTGKKL